MRNLPETDQVVESERVLYPMCAEGMEAQPMRGLTPKEYVALVYVSSPHVPRPISAEEMALAEELETQGRIALVHLDDRRSRYVITPAGREALRLWPAVQEALGATP